MKFGIDEAAPFVKKENNKRKTKMNTIVTKIKKVDQHLSRTIGQYRAKHKKTPTELDLMQDAVAIPLVTQRKRLVKQYEYLKQEKQYAENTYKTIKDDPVKQAQRSFHGIRNESPFKPGSEYMVPNYNKAVTPINRIGNNTSKQGTLWDPRFNQSDVRVDPKIARYYRRLSGGY
jgi:hypothetical protein